MADSKISALTELAAGSVAPEEDVFEIVDTSATANKKVKVSSILGMPPPADVTGGTYTFGIADAFRPVVFNSGSAQVATIPLNSAIPYPIGTKIKCLRKGAGTVKVSPDSGVTLNL